MKQLWRSPKEQARVFPLAIDRLLEAFLEHSRAFFYCLLISSVLYLKSCMSHGFDHVDRVFAWRFWHWWIYHPYWSLYFPYHADLWIFGGAWTMTAGDFIIHSHHCMESTVWKCNLFCILVFALTDTDLTNMLKSAFSIICHPAGDFLLC